MLYNIIITPIEIIVEWAFQFIYNRFSNLNVIYSVFGVSLVINFLALPLYNIADKLQEKERNISKALEPRVKRIKKAFKGDEQFLIISEYYRQNNYHPLYVLRSSLSILIEIPFFIAAYHYLSHCELLMGAHWLFFKDLGSPDELIKFSIGSKQIIINILPILMTLINFISGAIYCKEAPLREKLQLYGVAIVFLALLYKSPSGLVIYWILNNIFSLFKNIVMKMKNPKKVLHIILTVCLIGLTLMFWFFKPDTDQWKRYFLTFITILFGLIPYIYSRFIKNKLLHNFSQNNTNQNENKNFFIFLSSAIMLWILCGLLLPANVIASSPAEFSFIGNTESPITYISSSFSFFFGLFVVWPLIIYKMFDKKVKKILPILFVTIAVCSLLNVYIFKPTYGTFTNMYQISSKFENLTLSKTKYLIAFITSILIFFLFSILSNFRKNSFLSLIIFGIAIAELSFGLYKISFIKKEFKEYKISRSSDTQNNDTQSVYHFSKTKENIIVLFLDRAIGSFPPYIFEQFPEIAEELTGFTYYPNTVSSGGNTITGIPPIMGGYEYSAYENYKRNEDLLVDKHNEALLVMPKLFLDAGYEVTFTDPSMPNYAWSGDFTPFEKYPQINVSDQIGKYTSKFLNEKNMELIKDPDKFTNKQTKNFSILQIMFPAFRILFYNTAFVIPFYPKQFCDNISQLYYLPQLIDFDATSNTFTIIENELTHRLVWLEPNNYEIPVALKNTSNKQNIYQSHNDNDLQDYIVNIAAFKQVVKIVQYLKQNNVYDNTRIIIVSDHGYNNIYTKFNNFKKPIVPSQYNCLLMFKDFNSNEPLKTDNTFMTNADTLFLAKQDTNVSNINPFTNKELVQDKDYVICCPITKSQWNCRNMLNKKQIDYSKAECWKVHDDIFNPDNWERFEIK